MKLKVYFRVDSNSEIGFGHIIRCTAISDILRDDFSCTFLIKNPSEYLIGEISATGANYIVIPESQNILVEAKIITEKYIQKQDIVLIDGYQFKTEYQEILRRSGCNIVYIDDFNDKDYICDALINNIPGFTEQSFKKKSYTKLYLGTDYALLRKEFFNPSLRKIAKKRKTILVSFGGADIYNLSLKIIQFINKIRPDYSINVLIGDAYMHNETLKNISNVKLHHNISAKDVAELIAQSKICIIPASSILNEAACVGSKILVGYFVDNQVQPYNYFIENQMAIGIGNIHELTLTLLKTKFEEVLKADCLIENQFQKYRFQQIENIKNIFYQL